jgi:NADP-dependent 3-hydroxy acid dehydrogenase YdfG
LAGAGFHVLLGARRADRIRALATELGGHAQPVDVTDPASVGSFAEWVSGFGPLRVLVNNAGGAVGMDPVAAGQPEDWRAMYEVNVLGSLQVTQALLPALEASGRGDVVFVTSTAARIVYEGGGGYTAAKHAQTALVETLRLELVGRPVRVSEIAPGMVATEEFSVRRFRGDVGAAAQVYAGVPNPLTDADVADCIAWVVTRPAHVDVDLLVIRPVAQAAQHRVYRTDSGPSPTAPTRPAGPPSATSARQ